MARRRLEGLERVLGVNALFATAYGNVGSSIYYALGLVASYALGLTPVVFVITGFFFYCTAATYAEATAMYPEAGGSSSFARRAFNEFWSFFAAWGQMLNYVITIAISAFFVPHYIGGLFWEPLRSAPGDIIGGAIVIAVLATINVVGVKESAGLNILLAVVDFLTQLLLVALGAVLVFSPEILVENVQFGIAPTWEAFVDLDPARDDRLHRHRDDLQHGRGGQGRDHEHPGRHQPGPHRRVRDLLHAARDRALSASRRAGRRRVSDQARPARGRGRLRGRPDPRRRQADRPRAAAVGR